MKLRIKCDYCGTEIVRYDYKVNKHNFCSKECLWKYSSKKTNPNGYVNLKDYSKIGKHFENLNRKLNPYRMTAKTREKIRISKLDKGNSNTYRKFYGKHEHRIVAEKILGRKLKKGEVVHHVDGNKRNNSVPNIKVFSSQAEHAKFHSELTAVLTQLNS